MNSKKKLMAMIPAMVLGIGLAIPALAQDASAPVSASTSMDRAGSDTTGAAKNAYTGTVTALSDTKITTEVKAAFASGKDIESNHIHVKTVAGIVTLRGRVQSPDMSSRVESIARNASGVRGVNNDLRVSSVQD
ncbi:MAG: BON domain-containing protein [Candidatus Binataceae bacterium]